MFHDVFGETPKTAGGAPALPKGLCRARRGGTSWGKFFAALLCSLLPWTGSAEPPPREVIALIGGEDMVVAAESGELETQWQLAEAALGRQIVIRSLAWEGDTVYEQRRELNYPPLDEQVRKLQATTLVLEFGQMESLMGPPDVQKFTEAYEGLLDRLNPGGRCKIRLIVPAPFEVGAESSSLLSKGNESLAIYRRAIVALAKKGNFEAVVFGNEAHYSAGKEPLTRDGVHLNEAGQRLLAKEFATQPERSLRIGGPGEDAALRQLIQKKNALWNYYNRPENWAFLNGDRTNQPSSRDHLDPTKRWFPGEMEEFIPMIGKLEAQITAAAFRQAP